MTPEPVRHGRWRVCALLAAGPTFETSGIAATATATIETGFKPLYSVDDRPRVAWAGRTTLRCARGSWIARPRHRMSVSWSLDGRPLRGERRWTLRSRGNGEYRCRVVARNRHGTTVALAPPFPVQPWISR